jgi:hypothetical protein
MKCLSEMCLVAPPFVYQTLVYSSSTYRAWDKGIVMQQIATEKIWRNIYQHEEKNQDESLSTHKRQADQNLRLLWH